ncbi:MAG: magnesium transporter [Planctomycetota bacterium]
MIPLYFAPVDDKRKEMSSLERLIREGSDEDIRRFFLLLRPADMADVLEASPEEDRLRVLRLMQAPLATEVLMEVQEGDREELFEELSPDERAEIVHEAMSDDAVDLIAALPEEEQAETLRKLDAEEREEIKGLLEYDEDTAGGIMQTEVVTARASDTVSEAIERVRSADTEAVGEILEVFIVDAQERLVGSVSPADLLHAESGDSVRSICEPNPVSVSVAMDQELIADLVRDHNLAAIPVVDAQGRLVGQILHDDIADVIEEEATEDIAKMAGADPDEVYDDSVWRAVRSRLVWLAPAFVGGVLVAVFVHSVEEGIPVAVSAYLVVVVGMAGGVGTQNAALTVRSLALGRIDSSRAWGVISRQILTGVILGTVFGLAVYAFAFAQGASHAAGLTVAMAMLGAMSMGAALGVVVPLVLHRLGADPAVAASPFIQTANDVVGAGILIWAARALGLL